MLAQSGDRERAPGDGEHHRRGQLPDPGVFHVSGSRAEAGGDPAAQRHGRRVCADENYPGGPGFTAKGNTGA
jgi:hypothetical protein